MTALLGRLGGGTRPLTWRRVRAFDWTLLAAVVGAVLLGMALIYSATLRAEVESSWDDLVVKQAVFFLIGLGAMALFTATDYRIPLAFGAWLYVGTVLLLAGLFAVGTIRGGAERWFNIGIADIQPSEFAKLTAIVFLAAYFERFDIRRLRHVLGSMALVGLVMALVLVQPDLSTSLIIGAIWLGMVFVAGIRPVHLGLMALSVPPLAWLGLRFGLQLGVIRPYMFERVSAWLDPYADPLGSGWNSIHSLIAVGSGGLTGTGFASGPLAKGGWLSFLYTDNIFVLASEELGFVGGVSLLALLAFIVLRVTRTAGRAQDRAGLLVATGVATYIGVQVFVNVGVAVQLLPATGVALPFISYGGSSLVALLCAIGLVQSVQIRRKPLEFT